MNRAAGFGSGRRRLALGAALFVIAVRAAACPRPFEVKQAQLLGDWDAQVEGASAVVMTLRQHPEYAETVRGFLDRAGQRVELAGDVDEGDFTLEESGDGKRISAVWLGEVVDGSCGREIRGTWKAEGSALERAFVLRKRP